VYKDEPPAERVKYMSIAEAFSKNQSESPGGPGPQPLPTHL